MQDLDARIAARKEREKARIESGEARDPALQNHAGEAQDSDGKNLGDGTRKEGAQGAGGSWSPPGKAGKALPTPPAAPAAPVAPGTDPTA